MRPSEQLAAILPGKMVKIKTLHCWLNVSRAQYAIARERLAEANKTKGNRGAALRACRHWRNEILTTAIQLRVRLIGRRK
jgi:hypothetical protein